MRALLHHPDFRLLLVYLLLCGCVWLRVLGDPVGFTATDSYYYLEAAKSLVAGHGPMVTAFPNSEVTDTNEIVYLTAFPIGYPVFIAAISWLSGLSVFWASKVVNLLALGGAVLVLRKFSYRNAWLLGLVFGVFTLLEVLSYTWSEALFIYLQLQLGYLLFLFLTKRETPISGWFMGVTGCLLFAVKYIGVYAIGLLLLAAAWLFWKNRKRAAVKLVSVALGITAFVVFYLYLNYRLAGFIWGGDRIFNSGKTVWHFASALTRGVFNELNLMRHYYFRGRFDPLFFVLLGVQLVWLGFIYFRSIRGKIRFQFSETDLLPKFFWLMGGVYLLSLIGLRLLSPFDAFYYRLMAPASMFFYLGILAFLTSEERRAQSPNLQLHLAVFLLFCLLFQLPKAWLLSLL